MKIRHNTTKEIKIVHINQVYIPNLPLIHIPLAKFYTRIIGIYTLFL